MENSEQLFVWGTLKKGTHWYKTLVEPYILEDKTVFAHIPFTRVGHAAIFRFGGKHQMDGYLYTLDPEADLKEMWNGLDAHEGSPTHFRLITLENGWLTYEYNFDPIATEEQVRALVESEEPAYGS